MIIIEKITFILFGSLFVFLWNKYIVTDLIHYVVKKNSENKWLASKQTKITKGFQSFYWIGYIVITISLLISE